MIVVKGAVKRFGAQTVLNGIDFSVEKGERVIVLGQNGAGKTTLLRAILGQYRLDLGSVTIGGFDPIRQRLSALLLVAYIPQLPPPLPMTVGGLLTFSESVSGVAPRTVIDVCKKFSLDLTGHLNKPFGKLSGGMKQKLLCSIAFARKAPLMLFDEPTANLDPEAREVFSQLVASEDLEGTTMVFISHRIEELGAMLDRAVWLDLGRVVKNVQLH